jgi:hypothetical protein
VDVLLKGADYSFWQPRRAFMVSLILWGLPLLSFVLRAWRSKVRVWPPLVAALAWVAFGLMEYQAYRERANIRVDYLITWPSLWLLTADAIRQLEGLHSCERAVAVGR